MRILKYSSWPQISSAKARIIIHRKEQKKTDDQLKALAKKVKRDADDIGQEG